MHWPYQLQGVLGGCSAQRRVWMEMVAEGRQAASRAVQQTVSRTPCRLYNAVPRSKLDVTSNLVSDGQVGLACSPTYLLGELPPAPARGRSGAGLA